jgi:hypothetical protein
LLGRSSSMILCIIVRRLARALLLAVLAVSLTPIGSLRVSRFIVLLELGEMNQSRGFSFFVSFAICCVIWREFGTVIYLGEVDVDFAQATGLGYSWGRMNRQMMTYFSSMIFVFSISVAKCYWIGSRSISRHSWSPRA